MKKSEITRVIFRKFKKTKTDEGGDIIAVFPELKTGTLSLGYSWYDVTSYMHLGQHGDCNWNAVLDITVPCKDRSEYIDLLRELKYIGYKNLKICQRFFKQGGLK